MFIYLSVCLSVFSNPSLSHTHTHTHIYAHSHSLLLFWRDQIKSETQAPKDVFHTYSSTAPPPHHTKTNKNMCFQHPHPSHARMDSSTNKQTNTHFSQICQTTPPPKKTNSPHHRFTEVMLGQHLLSPIPPAPTIPSKISPSAPTSPSTTFCFPSTHTHTHTRNLNFLLPNLSPYSTVS